jgi:hypothetical protein
LAPKIGDIYLSCRKNGMLELWHDGFLSGIYLIAIIKKSNSEFITPYSCIPAFQKHPETL